ncbi:MAG: polysaccharide biosynthesis/export family protein, partial [Desulfobulbaceae bacterium]|nr:polysaccharide biosynthesis/export family protein [Desulfobulbaceae bacterium]
MEWKKSLLLPALLLALASLAAEPPLAAAAEPAPAVAAAMAGSENSAYLIGPGDVLAISVWKDDALSKVVPVLPDGTVSMPLIGQVAAGGSTVAALQKSLVEKVSAYVPDPVLTVQVQQVNSLMVYVVGKANHPGRFVLNGTVNVLQVLAMAG